jgi:hypothetical protein
MPDNPHGPGGGNWDNSAGRGFTMRRVGGELRAFSTQYEVLDPKHHIYEMVVPTSYGATVGSSPQATTERFWGLPTNAPDGIYNLHWDEELSKLWYIGGDSYIDNGDFICFGNCTLNEGAGTLDSTVAWRLNGKSSKQVMHGMNRIPDWFVDAYLPAGMTHVLGFGGYESLVESGSASIGPSLCAFNPSQLGANGSALSSTYWKSLLCYPYNATPYTTPTRAHRDTDYSTTMANSPYWNPSGGIGYWCEQDYIWGGGCWVDTGTKHGFICYAIPCVGRAAYVSSALEALDGCKHTAQIYDPLDIAEVAQGNETEDWPQPVERWDVQFQSMSYPMPAWRDLPFQIPSGVFYDSVTGRLHVAIKEANGASPNPNPNVVHVYQVAA